MTAADAALEVARWHRYAWKLARAWHATFPWLELDDLHAEVLCGFAHAANKFDHTRGVRFSTYATWWANMRCRRYARAESGRGVTVPSRGLFRTRTHASLNDTIPGTDRPRSDLHGRHDPPHTDHYLWDRVRRVLTALEYESVALYYRDGYNTVEIGRMLGVSRACIHQRLKTALYKLRRRLPHRGEK